MKQGAEANPSYRFLLELVDCLAWFATARQLTINAKFAKNAKNLSEIHTLRT
jgi:hypothetical protein